MRQYSTPNGTPVPPELQEQIADDVRAFDRAQEPDARSAVALRKIGNELLRIRAVVSDISDGQDKIVQAFDRMATAQEIAALSDLGFSPEVLRSAPGVIRLIRRYDLENIYPTEGN